MGNAGLQTFSEPLASRETGRLGDRRHRQEKRSWSSHGSLCFLYSPPATCLASMEESACQR